MLFFFFALLPQSRSQPQPPAPFSSGLETLHGRLSREVACRLWDPHHCVHPLCLDGRAFEVQCLTVTCSKSARDLVTSSVSPHNWCIMHGTKSIYVSLGFYNIYQEYLKGSLLCQNILSQSCLSWIRTGGSHQREESLPQKPPTTEHAFCFCTQTLTFA